MSPTPFLVANQALPLASTAMARTSSSGNHRRPCRYSQFLPSKRDERRFAVASQMTPVLARGNRSYLGREGNPVGRGIGFVPALHSSGAYVQIFDPESRSRSGISVTREPHGVLATSGHRKTALSSRFLRETCPFTTATR